MRMIAPGTKTHQLPVDLKAVLALDNETTRLWNDITPLARNEFICWVLSAKQPATRARRIQRTREELLDGKRRPCCWIGCTHRTDKPMSRSQAYILGDKH